MLFVGCRYIFIWYLSHGLLLLMSNCDEGVNIADADADADANSLVPQS